MEEGGCQHDWLDEKKAPFKKLRNFHLEEQLHKKGGSLALFPLATPAAADALLSLRAIEKRHWRSKKSQAGTGPQTLFKWLGLVSGLKAFTHQARNR